ncbi:Uncharacterised protein r2_g2300 [Pycnogonum litorale]
MAVFKPRYKLLDESVDDFIKYFERLMISNDWSDEISAKHFPALLESNTRFHSKIEGLSEANRKKFSVLKSAILDEEEPYRVSNCNKLLNAKLKPNQNIEEFRDEILKLVEKVYPSFAKSNKKVLACDFFVNGLTYSLKNSMLQAPDHAKTLEQAVNIAILAHQITEKSQFQSQRKKSHNYLKASTSKVFKCYNCQQPGHLARDCKNNSKEKKQTVSYLDNLNKRYYIEGFINKRKENFLLDTGASISVLPVTSYKPDKPDDTILRATDGRNLKVYGSLNADLQFGHIRDKVNCLVADVNTPILGIDFLKKHEAKIDLNGLIEFPNDNTTVKLSEEVTSNHKLETTSTLKFLNIIEAKDLYSDDDKAEGDKEANNSEMQQTQILLNKYDSLFKGLGKTNLITHSIETGHSKPIRSYTYRVPLADMKESRENIEEMLQEDVITHSKSEWSSPVIPVRKKDGELI